MADLNVRPEAVDVEQIMQQLRARIRERRGADYTDAELQQLAGARLEQLLEARGAGSSLGHRFLHPPAPGPELPGYEFEDSTLFATHRGPLGALRKLLRPILKLFFNPDPLSRALHLQARLNTEFQRRLRLREEMDPVLAEVIRGLVVEVTRASLEVQSLKMRLESLATRLDFDERRGRPREIPATPAPSRQQSPGPPSAETPGQPVPARSDQRPGETAGPTGERRRRRRRRRRRGGATGDSQPAESQHGGPPAESSGAPLPIDDGNAAGDADEFMPSGAADEDVGADTDEP
jgi:hypothetical protein